MNYFSKSKDLNFDEVWLTNFFPGLCFGCHVQELFAWLQVMKIFSYALFSSKRFIVLHFTFRPVIYFELISYKELIWGSCFSIYRCPIVLISFVVKTLLSSLNGLGMFVKNQFVSMWIWFWVLYYIPLVSASFPLIIPHYLDSVKLCNVNL